MSDTVPPSVPRRRWLRFGLGTLLVFIAVLALALNVVVSGVRQKQNRHALLGRHIAPRSFDYQESPFTPPLRPKPYLTIQPSAESLAWGLRLWGEREVAQFNLFLPPNDPRQDEIELASSLFPEAVIHVYRMRGRRPPKNAQP